MRIIGYNDQGNLITIDFASIEIDKFHGIVTENKCRLLLNGYTYTQYYIIVRRSEREDGTLAMTKKEAEKIIEAVSYCECADLRAMGDFKITSETRWETVFIRNDIDDYELEEIPIVISEAKE